MLPDVGCEIDVSPFESETPEDGHPCYMKRRGETMRSEILRGMQRRQMPTVKA